MPAPPKGPARPAGWRRAHRLLAARAAAAPLALERSLDCSWPRLDLGRPRRLVTTGVGSSEAHARFLAQVVDEHTALPARFQPLGALVLPPRRAREDLLVVFSQGLSPNARLVLASAGEWHRVVLATASREEALLAPLHAAGVQVVPFEGGEERGTLLRVQGPLAAYGAAMRLAALLGAPLPLDPSSLRPALAAAECGAAAVPDSALDAPLVLVASGSHLELTRALSAKVLEGLLVPAPPVWELLHLAHGPFQQAFPTSHTFVALTRADAPDEPALLARLASMLEPSRHRLVRLPATLPGPLAVLEHELATTVLLLRAIARRRLDQARWPGRGRDRPLYALAAPPVRRRLETMTWPEVEGAIAGGARTAIVPLGSIEQHGAHLPLATDAWIAEALADAVCAAVPGSVACPVIRLGCAAEHLAFPGTLHLAPPTLEAVLHDVLAALARHGVRRALVFSAHGGNLPALREMVPRLRAALPALAIVTVTDLERVTAVLHAAAAAAGIPAGVAGHHAGEIETSILLALRPGDLRANRFAAGALVDTTDASHVFYPDLRATAPTGTVGDPRPADPARGLVYLAAWSRLLVDALAAGE